MFDHESQRVRNLRGQLAALMRSIRATTPQLPVDPTTAKTSETWGGHFLGKPIHRVIIYLRSSGCSWAIGRNPDGTPSLKAGCLDCVHSIAGTTFGLPISPEAYVTQFLSEYRRYDFSKYNMLCLYNEGNFFNPDELPPRARRDILKIISQDSGIRTVILESLPEFITDSVLRETASILGDRHVEIGIGLESINPLIRSLCVNKSYTLDEFVRVVPLVKQYFRVLAYILQKPCFVTERESIVDVVDTGRYAFRAGADVVSIEPVNLSDYNMSGVLHKLGLHRAPWLWSVVETVRALSAEGELRVGGDQFAPTYLHHPHNCPSCTPFFKRALDDFNATLDPRPLESLACDCLDEWKRELQSSDSTMLDRIERALEPLRCHLQQ